MLPFLVVAPLVRALGRQVLEGTAAKTYNYLEQGTTARKIPLVYYSVLLLYSLDWRLKHIVLRLDKQRQRYGHTPAHQHTQPHGKPQVGVYARLNTNP